MSKLETNTIDTISGTNTLQVGDGNVATINLGKSGDTINIPSGATFNVAGTPGTGFGSNTPLFRATVSGTQAVPDSTATKIDFNTEVYDPQSTYDTSNKRFTPAVAGYYFIAGKIRTAINNDFGYFTIQIRKNGTVISAANNAHFNLDSVVASVIDLADDNDYYEIYTYHNKGTTENYSGDANEMQFFGNKLIT